MPRKPRPKPKVFRIYHENDGTITVKYKCPVSEKYHRVSAKAVNEIRRALEAVPQG